MQASKHGLASNEIPWQAMRWQQNDSKHARVGNQRCLQLKIEMQHLLVLQRELTDLSQRVREDKSALEVVSDEYLLSFCAC